MCGRISLKSSPESISGYFDLVESPLLDPRWNIAPGQQIFAVRSNHAGIRTSARLHWGLVPSWAKEKSVGYKMINARAETLTEKPSFRSAYRSRRCLVPVDGFYEWQRVDQQKQAYHIRKTDFGLFALAGIWESWTDKDSRESLESCSIITTVANSLLQPIHQRMPVIVPSADFVEWLNPELSNPVRLLQPYEWQGFEAVAVSTYVNNAQHEGSECAEVLA